jgi:hypothetical protein
MLAASAGLSGREQFREFNRMEKAPPISTITASAAGRELGELFEYHIPTPVTVLVRQTFDGTKTDIRWHKWPD